MCPMSSVPSDAPHREPTPEELAKQQGVPARGASHYAKGTAANIVRSMAVIVAITLALFFMTGRQNTTTPQKIDVQAVAADRGAQAGQTFAYGEDLPDDWLATSARYTRTTGGIMMWDAGYTISDEEYVSVRQALGAPEEWLRAQTRKGERTGAFESADGRRWMRYESEDEGKRLRSLVADPKGAKKLTTVVVGTGSWAQVETLAEHLVEAEPAAGEPSTSPTS